MLTPDARHGRSFCHSRRTRPAPVAQHMRSTLIGCRKRLLESLSHAPVDLHAVATLIERDPLLSSFLQSAIPGYVPTSLAQYIVEFGIERLKSLVLAADAYSGRLQITREVMS